LPHSRKNEDPIIITPTSTKVAELIKSQFPQENIWIHLTASEKIRQERLRLRDPNISDNELQKRTNGGDSQGSNYEADINLNTSDLNPNQIFLQTIAIVSKDSRTRQIFEMPNIEMNKARYSKESNTTQITAETIDDLVRQGVIQIEKEGERFNARAGSGIQTYNTNYTLLGSKNREHWLRDPISNKYFARELLAYFGGSLKVEEGLSQASSFWNKLADQNGEICSNYGHYVFHQKLENYYNKTQLDWIIDSLTSNKDSRKAIININQPKHKSDTKDFPCTVSMQFYIRNNQVCCEVNSRSTDIYTGLPYDMGFFSFVNELMFGLLKEKYPEITLGHTTMRANFTQIYDKTKNEALKLKSNFSDKDNSERDYMPPIDNANQVLEDIYDDTSNSSVMQWIRQKADLNN
jgi:thymidylate synthase